MSEKGKSLLLRYGICSGVCLVCVISQLWSADIFSMDLTDQLRTLCDAFTLPGMLCLFGGLMFWLSNEGAFTAIGFIMTYVFRSLIPGPGKRENYGEYRERTMGNKVSGYAFLFVIGGICMAISFLFLALFHMQRS